MSMATHKSTCLQLTFTKSEETKLISALFGDMAQFKEYWNTWVVADGLAKAVLKRYSLPHGIELTGNLLNSVLAKCPIMKAHHFQNVIEPNTLGIYKATY